MTNNRNYKVSGKKMLPNRYNVHRNVAKKLRRQLDWRKLAMKSNQEIEMKEAIK
jgi:hypothetical protein